MKKGIRILSLILTFTVLLSVVSFASSNETSQFIEYENAYCTRTGGLTVYFEIDASSQMLDIGATKVEIYDSSDNLVKTFKYTDIGYSTMLGHNRTSYSSSVTYSEATSGARYYAVVYFKVWCIDGSDTYTFTTSSVVAS